MDRERDKRVVLGFSGGVDSTAAALLLQGKGYDVTGLFFDVTGMGGREAERAERAASELGVPFLYRDISRRFQERIVSYFCDSYACGKTPNPCIFCNPGVKFRVLEEAADACGVPYIATGHYARVIQDPDHGFFVYKGKNKKKDQSYMLYRLRQETLSRVIFPLGEWEDKGELRRMLEEAGLHNAEAKDSQEICFLEEGTHYIDYLLQHGVKARPGNFVDRQGNVLGKHKGIVHYTIGQRKGLGVTFGKPMFVVELDAEKNEVVLGDNEELFANEVFFSDAVFSGNLTADQLEGETVQAKIRYAAPASDAVFRKGDRGYRLLFREGQRAATPGQSVVFYQGEQLLGGGVIGIGR